LPEVAHRFEGYRRALSRSDVAATDELVRRTPFVEGSARHAVNEMIEKKIAFDAIFASSDMLAMEAISAMRDKGLDVPNDVAVVGYDDVVLARYCHPALTTIRQPVASGAEALVDALLEIVEGKRPKPRILPAELIMRESSVRYEAAH